MCRNCAGFPLHPTTSAAGPSLAAEEQQLASARRRKRHLEGTSTDVQPGPLAARVSGSSAVQLDTQRTEDRGEQQSKRLRTDGRVEGQQGQRDPSPTQSQPTLESSATLSQDGSMAG